MQVWFHFQDDANQLSRDHITNALAQEGIACRGCGTGSDPPFGLTIFEKESPDLLEFVQQSTRNGSDRIMVVAVDKAALAGAIPWKLMQAGASDVLAWNSSNNPAATIAARLHRWQAVEDVVNSALVKDNLVGRSRAWVSVLRQVVEVARYTDTSVLITGESGTGKELIARLIHTLDTRPKKHDLVVLDCTTVVPELSGSEFFGHERGAFTHAVASRDGAFGLADGGSLFLDEVGELPLSLQAELLRIVQERTYKRIGSNVWKSVNFRLICATNRNLEEEKARGTFRLDFYHRIAS
ncbi:MAG TPA: sigma-54 factor interaction domain-containing protein [Haliangiales bacterium]|nr:sigma-54 factor interaction domain-containing protein [Haliangiales bacterium]